MKNRSLGMLVMAIGATSVWIGQRGGEGRSFFPVCGRRLAWYMAIAAICDASENLLLLSELNGSVTHTSIRLIGIVATVKFAIVGVALTFVATGLISLLIHRSTRESAGETDISMT